MRNRPFSRLPAVIAIVMAMLGFTAGQIYAYSERTTDQHADAAIVLGAAVWGSEPSPVFRERINHAVQLYHSAQVDYIIFTGRQGDPSEPAEAVVGRQYAIEQDVPEADIWIETQSWTTRQNLIYARQIACSHDVKTFLLVSDPLHMRRAMLIARDLGMDVYPSPTPTTMYRTWASKGRMLWRETRLYLSYLWHRPYAVQWRL